MTTPDRAPTRTRRALTLALQIALYGVGLCLLFFAIRQVHPAFLRDALDTMLIEDCKAEAKQSCDLIPEYFQIGQSREEVVAVLTGRGYSHTFPLPIVPYSGDVRFTDSFGKDLGMALFVCSLDLGIWMTFDESGRLVETHANSGATCI